MANFSERQIRWVLGAVDAGSFAILPSLEILIETDRLSPLGGRL